MKAVLHVTLTGALLVPFLAYSDTPNQKIEMPTVPARAKVITTPTAPIVKDNDNLFFSAEYLFMRASEGSLSYARQNFPVGAYGDQQKRKCYEANFDWNSGFRIGMGYNIGHDRWDTQVNWTWMLSKGHDHHSDSISGLFSTNAVPSVDAEEGVRANSFQSDIHLHLNILDWQLGREFFLSKWLKLRPFTGIRTSWVHQNWKTTATGNIIAMNNALESYRVNMKQKFWGIGPMIGINSEWGIVNYLSLYANGSFALLSGFFNDHRNDVGLQMFPPAQINNPFSKQTFRAQSVTELQIGLRWNQWCGHDRYRLAIQAGWDVILFSDHNHLFAINGQSGAYGQTQHLAELTGDLMFQGLSVGLRLDF